MTVKQSVDELIEVFGTARQALLHLSEPTLENMPDEVVDALFEAAGLGGMLLPVEDAGEPMNISRRRRR